MKYGTANILRIENSISKIKLGYILIISSASLAALVHVASKPLLGPIVGEFAIHPILLAALIYIINGIFFTPFAKGKNSFQQIGTKNLVLLALIGIAEVSGLITYFFGLKDSTAINASIFSNGEIIFSLLIAIVIFRERLQKKEITPFVMIIIGMIILPVAYDFYENGIKFDGLVIGDLLIILSGFLYALDINASKYVSDRFDSKRIGQLTSFAAGVFALALVFTFNIPLNINLEQLPAVALIAIAGTGISTLFFIISLRLLGAMRTVLLYSTTAIFGIIFSTILLSEEITLHNIISMILVMSGIYFLRNRLGEDEKKNSSTREKVQNPI